MGLFGRLWRQPRLELPPMVQRCDVHFGPRGIFVSSVHRDVSGMSPNGDPMSLLPLDAEPTTIGKAVLESLYGSRDGLTEEEFTLQMSMAVEMIGERSWDDVEKRWNLIAVGLPDDGKTVTIGAMHRYETGGYIATVDDPVYECPPDAEEVGRTIRAIIDGPPPQMLNEAMLGIPEEQTEDERRLNEPATEIDSEKDVGVSPLSIEFGIDDRVKDAFGNEATVVDIDPEAKQGLGTITVRFDDGREATYALLASGLERLDR